ncbi:MULTISPECIES: aminomethyltransferase family protein [Klebsiella]|jgi:glycine cleavage system aminomethyltransferase T|uniref:Aminomethyl transferase family protein n=1 Tax=Klebsiella oxytoca TaxID=571 RepID=A0A9P0U6U9_KLEOX|nr:MULTISPECIES: aminomethyltransferase family protein [Klebsiella]EGT0043510.1 aminomethyl transferase family protein [Klebsiella oxytoca]EJM1002548.1 aminomethyltransferase family protein [Klebsiella oxytoca]EKQ7238068.1 aminomethyltransferase family protein [Klebsiella oxytoca]EKY0602876.1 aminomethyltransferase family protein [Klebsiella oxytoca]ELR0730084.1 aminomethyltransferase family protein [Klebsiella oxytoca]
MSSLFDLHLKDNAVMGNYNNRSIPSSYHDILDEYKAVRENALLVDYSHMAIVSVTGEDAWILVNHIASADISIVRDEQGIYSLVLNDDGTILGDMYVLCAMDGYYILSENISVARIIEVLKFAAEKYDDLGIQENPEIKSMEDDNWGAIMLEGPYSWELMSEIYGYDIIGLPYCEYMNTEDDLIVFRCGKHGEFAYQVIGPQSLLVELWVKLQKIGVKYLLKTGGLDYQRIVRVENPGWDQSIYAEYSTNPVELQLQWAIQYDKEDFIGKAAVELMSAQSAARKVVGIVPCVNCASLSKDDKILVNGQTVGFIINAVYSPAAQSWIALAFINTPYALSDIDGYIIKTAHGDIAAKTKTLPFIYNFSLLVNPTTHSYIDPSKAKSVL